MPKTPDDIFKKKLDYLTKSEKALSKRVVAFQTKLYQLIASEYLPLFSLKDGIITDTQANIALINSLDLYFDKLEKAMHRDVLAYFANTLLQSASLSSEYYVAMGFKKTVLDEVLKNKVAIEKRIGITPTGRVRKDGYLYNLGRTDQVRQQLKNYVINSITGDVPFLDFQLGFRNLVIGNRRVKGLSTDGSLQKYFDQYAYDTYNDMDAIANKQIASNLGLEHFIYEGSLIETSRRFCEKRAGKAFKVSDTKTWKDDPDLIDKKTKDSYRPLVERGRYRCRHFIKYITEELYNELTNAS